MLLSEDYPQILQTRRGICILIDSEVVLKDGVNCSKLAVFAISTDRTVEIVTKKLSWTNLIPWRRTAPYHLN